MFLHHILTLSYLIMALLVAFVFFLLHNSLSMHCIQISHGCDVSSLNNQKFTCECDGCGKSPPADLLTTTQKNVGLLSNIYSKPAEKWTKVMHPVNRATETWKKVVAK